MSPNGPSDYAPRVRAAHAYAGLKLDELAAALDISVRTLTRFESGEREPDYELRQRVAAICGVPDWFLEHGFSTEHVEPDVAERLEAMQHQISTQARTLERLQEVVKARAVLLEEYARDMDALRARIGATPPDPGAAVEAETAAPLPQPSPSRSPSNGPAGHAQ